MNDIVTRLRQTRADMLGSDDEQHYWDCHDAAAEIERLRLTDAEREAVDDGLRCVEYVAAHGDPARADLASSAATLRGLLERTAERREN